MLTYGPVAFARSPGRRESVGVAAVVALVAFLPFVRGVLAGHSFYFRDLSLQFWPVRRFIAEGLAGGVFRYWNPYTHEGEPLSLLPVGYPFDLLQALWPSEAGFSLLLALHIPLAAVAFFALGRGLGTSRLAAAGGALAYALGGFTLSTLNLYVYAQTVAWAPLLILALLRVPDGSSRGLAVAAVAVALCLSTTGAEIAAQAILFGVVIAWPTSSRGWARLALAIALGVGLAGFVLLPTAALLKGTSREAGFATEIVLAHSVHPVTWLQTVIAGLYGDPSDLAQRFWGENFFPRGFPYVLSLYLGLVVLALAATAVTERRPYAARIALLGALAVVVCLGRFAVLEGVVDAAPLLRRFRYPTKAFFTVQASVALLAALGLHVLASGERRAWKRFALLAAAPGLALVASAWAIPSWASLHRALLAGFFPPYYDWTRRVTCAQAIGTDALSGGLLAVAVGGLGALVLARRLPAPRAALAVVAVVGADLIRAGAGLNPMVSPSFFSRSLEVNALADALKREGGRTFVFDPSYSESYYRARAGRGGNHEVWSFRVLQSVFTPDFNLGPRVATALSLDRTMLVPVDRVLDTSQASPAALPGLIDRMRSAGVRSLLSVDPLEHTAIAPLTVVTPPDLEPLRVHVYGLRDPLPLRSLDPPTAGRIVASVEDSDRIDLQVEADEPATVVLRDAFAPGWTALVNGAPVPIQPVEGRYRGVAVPAGRSRLEMRYVAPGLLIGIASSVASALLVAWLARPRRQDAPA